MKLLVKQKNQILTLQVVFQMTEKVTGLEDRLKDSEDRCLQLQNKAKEVWICVIEFEMTEHNFLAYGTKISY